MMEIFDWRVNVRSWIYALMPLLGYCTFASDVFMVTLQMKIVALPLTISFPIHKESIHLWHI
jgi:hypothetical protein